MAGQGASSGAADTTSSKRQTPGVLDRLFSLFMGSEDPEREKRRLLKRLGKSLSKSRQKYYKPNGRQALPAMGKLFFDIYKVVGPARTLLQHADESSGLRDIAAEAFFTEEQQTLKEQFSEEAIRALADTLDPKETASRLKDAMVQFFSTFDTATVRTINGAHDRLRTFISLIRFDYYFVLKKFDAGLQEGNYTAKPKFETIDGDDVGEDLKDFIEIAYTIDTNADWEPVFHVLNLYRGVDIVSRPAWKKLLAGLEDLRTSNVLVSIVQHIENDPVYKPTVRVTRERLVEPYLNRLKTTTEVTLQTIGNERRTRKIDQIAHAVFGTQPVVRAKNYTANANLVYSIRMLAGFIHTEAINYLKAFLLDYFKKEVRELVRDILLVRGQWSSNIMSQQMSESFHQVLTISEQLVQFDDSLAEDGELGSKLKRAVGRIVDRDKSSADQLRRLLHDINEMAKKMVHESAQKLIVMARQLKTVIDDYDRDGHEVILNWKQLEPMSEAPIKQRIVDMYKQIYYFIQLMQIYAKK